MEVQQDILTDLEDTIWYQDASTGIRLLHFVIDLFFIVLLVILANGFLFPEFTSNSIGERILIYVSLLFYYALLETATHGRTIGKLVTGTKAIRVDGTDFSGKDAVLRSLCRLVPFDTLSAISGQPWHDKWTKTRVVVVPR